MKRSTKAAAAALGVLVVATIAGPFLLEAQAATAPEFGGGIFPVLLQIIAALIQFGEIFF